MPSRLFFCFFFRTSLLLAALTCLLGWPRAAAAGELTYEAPRECPPRAAVAERTAARAPNARDAAVTIHKTGGRFAAHMSIGGGDDTVERDVEGRSCDAVIDAFVLVLSLDRPAPEEPPPPPPVAVIAPPPAPDAVTPEQPVKRAPVEIALVQDFELRKLGSTIFGGVVIAAEVGAPDLFDWKRYRPSARLGFVVLVERLELAEKIGDAFASGTLQACPIGVAPVSTRTLDVVFSLCAVVDGGRAETKAWFDGGGLLRASVQVGRKATFRTFFEVSGALLRRIGGDSEDGPSQPIIAYGLGGGVLFP